MTTGSKSSAILKDVLAYVDVWSSSKTENYSKPFIQQLQEMGAEVSKTLNKQVTHVVFKNGHHSTWNKAKKMGVRLVSVLWVARCKDDGEHVDEELWPALNEETNPAIKKKAHRCMQPKDTPERTPENDTRMKKKLDKMIKDIVPKSPLITDVSPYIIDEVNGIVYSPSLKRADYMAQRLKDMKEKRENLSPTASQLRECRSSPRLRSSPRSTPPASILHLLDEDSGDDFSSPIGAHLPSFDKRDRVFQCEESDNNRGVKNLFDKPWLSPCGRVSRPKPSFDNVNSELQEDIKGTTSGKRSKGILFKSDEFSFDAGNGPDSSMNDQLETKSVSPTITKWGPSSRKSKMTKSKREKTGSMTQSKTNADQQVLNTHRCPLSATRIETTHVTKHISEETCLPSLIVNKQTHELSAPARSSTVSNEPASITSCATTDENDDVFKDYFSPENDYFRQWRPVLPSSLSKSAMQVPFDLEPNQRKRRRKTSQTPEPESGHVKRKKHEEMQNVAHISQDSISVNSVSDPQEKPVGRKRRSRLVTMPVTSCSHLPAETTMQRALSNPAQPLKPSVVGACTTSYQQSDTGVISHHEGSETKTSQNYENASRGTEYVAAGLASNSSECKQVGVIDKSQDMDKKTKKCRTLVLTSMSTEKQQTVTQVVAALGGFSVVDQVCDSTTHVVSGGHRRTLNILLGIARGCWILSFEWILWCLEQRQWIPEEPYELSEHFPAAPICRLQQHLSAGEHQQDLFHGQPAMFVSHHSQPPTQSVVELIQLCGGTVCKTVRQAGICIGEYKGKRPEGCRILSEQWVLDCITRLQQLPYDSYTLE